MHALVCDHVRDAIGQHAGLTRTGPGEHQKRTGGRLHRLALGRIQAVEVDRSPCRGKPLIRLLLYQGLLCPMVRHGP